MGSGSNMILGGLLSGLGGGIVTQAAQKREDALLALRRQYQQEDATAADAREIAKEDRAAARGDIEFERESNLKVGLLGLANEYKKAEGETEQAYKERLLIIQSGLKKDEMKLGAKIDEDLNRKKEILKRGTDAASIRLTAEIEAGKVKEIKAAEDGSTVIIYQDGRRVVDKTIKLRDTSAGADDAGGGTIAAAQARAGGTPPAAAPAKPAAEKPAAAKPAAQSNDAEAIQRALNKQLAGGRKPDGTVAKKGEWISGPGGKGRAQWDGKMWVVYKL